jgi:hypothetical protein
VISFVWRPNSWEKHTLGTPLGHDCYKITLKITSKGKGKSGGMRVIRLVLAPSENIDIQQLPPEDKTGLFDLIGAISQRS